MFNTADVNLSDLLLSLSQAMEMAHTNLSNHQLRTAYIVWKMGARAGLPIEHHEQLFVAASLHDIGAFSPEEKMHVHDFELTNPERHCNRGALLFEQVPWLSPSTNIVKYHHRAWQNWNEPISTNYVLDSQMLMLADMAERHINRSRFILHQNKSITDFIRKSAGSKLHQDVIDLFMQVSNCDQFWLDLTSTNIKEILRKNGPFQHIFIEQEKVFAVSEIFRTIIDFRSPMTATHSCGIAACASMLGKIFGLTDSECRSIELAANLHDTGKLVVPDSILNKPGKLADDEYAILRQHAYVTYSVLSSVRGFEQITEYAAFHHEKLDGSGYPFGLDGHHIGTGSRIVAVADVFTALNEDRPYRPRMTEAEVITTLREFATKNFLDARIVELLIDNMTAIEQVMIEKQAITLNIYNEQFKPFTSDASS